MTVESMSRAKAAAAAAGLDAVLVTPGADLRYLTGYDALPLERLTCLLLRASGDPVLVVPTLERPAAEASPAGAMGIEISRLAGDRRPGGTRRGVGANSAPGRRR